MSTAMVEMNPDYSRQMYEPQPYSHRPPDPPVQTSGLVSDSDLQHKERQEKMKHEMLNDYNEHMRKKELQKPVYYRADPPEHGLPLGQYAQARKVLDEQRHREYNMYMHEKEEEANRKRQEMRRSPDHYKPPTRQSGEMYDHNAVSQRLSDDRRREYNDRLRRMEDLKRHPPRKTPTPPGGLPVGSYEEQRKLLQAQRTQEYRDSLLKQANEQWVRQAKEMHLDTSPVHEGHLQTERPLVGSPRDVIIDYKKMKQELGEKRKFDYNQYLNQKENESYKRSPPTPPVGLDIATEEERIRIAQLRKQQYGDELRRQQRDQIINRAQNQIMPVIDRRNQSPRREPNQAPPPVPPLNEIKRPPPSGRWDPDSYRQPNYAPVQSGEKPDSRGRPSSRDLPLARSQIKPKSQEQRTYSQDDPKLDSDLSLRLASPSHQANIGHEDLNAYRKKMERELRKSDYEAFLAKQQELEETRQQQRNAERTKPAAPVVKGHYYSSDTYDKRREELFKEQQRDYQDYLRKSKSESTGRLATPSHLVGLPLSQITYDTMRKQAERERNRDYNEMLSKKQAIEEPPRKPYNPNSSENRIGFMSSLGTSLNKQREQLAHQRHDEYNNFLKEKYAIHGKPWGRPTWVDRQDVPESWYRPARERGDSHRGDRPASHQYDDRANSVRRVPQTPSYQDMLDQKRRQEASYRRDDYQDYSRPGDRY